MSAVFSSRSPSGAVTSNTEVAFLLCVDYFFGCTEAFLRIFDENEMLISEIAMPLDYTWLGKDFRSANHRFTDNALYFYDFRLLCGTSESIFSNPTNGKKYVLTVYDGSYSSPAGFSGGLIYQIFPDRFFQGKNETKNPFSDRIIVSDKRATPKYAGLDEKNFSQKNNDYFCGDLAGITEKLDYLSELGVTTIYLNPVFEAHSNHRYNTADYTKIDPMLGTEADFCRLCSRAHKRGIKIILDGVFSHTGSDSVYFNSSKRYDSIGAANSTDSPYYGWYSFRKWPNDYECWWDVETLPNVNETNPSFTEYITGNNGVIRKWLRLGADGWRLDVADELPEEFIRAITRAAKNEKPDAIIIGEVWENAATKVSYSKRRHYLLGGELDSVMNYPLCNAVIDFVRNGNAENLGAVLVELYNDYPAPVRNMLMNHLGTHDTARLITRLAGEPENGRGRDWQAGMKLSAEQFSKGVQLVKMASALVYLVYGIPCVYYGDEIGMEGYGDPLNRFFFDWERINCDLHEHYTTIGQFRKEYTMLAEADFRLLSAKNNVLIFERTCGEKRLLFFANRSEKLMHADTEGGSVVLGNGTFEDGIITVAPYGWCVVFGAKKSS